MQPLTPTIPATDAHPGTTPAREAFVVELGAALHTAGTPSDRLEDMLTGVAEQLGLQSQFFSTPTSLMSGFGPFESQRVVLTRVQPGEPNLERLDALDRLAGAVARGDTGVAEGREHLRAITTSVRRYPGWLDPLCFGTASASVCVFFKGAPVDVAAAGLVGLIVGVFALVASRHRRVGRLMDFLAGLVAAFTAIALAAYVPGISSATVMLAGLIVLVPGLTLTLAVSELAARHLVSGTARFSHALMIFVAILFGAAIGRQFAPLLPPAGDPAPPVPAWAAWIAIAIVPSTLLVLFRAHPRDLWITTLGAITAFVGARTGSALLGPELGAAVGAFALGLLANLWARKVRRPAAIPTIPGLMLLVPGTIGLRSLTALLDQDAAGGVYTAFSMVLVAASIVAGLLFAQTALPSRQPL